MPTLYFCAILFKVDKSSWNKFHPPHASIIFLYFLKLSVSNSAIDGGCVLPKYRSDIIPDNVSGAHPQKTWFIVVVVVAALVDTISPVSSSCSSSSWSLSSL
jgi:hypothetical protein